MPITQNPTIDPTERDVFVYYLTGNSAIFGCIGSPENVIEAASPSVAIDRDTGNIYSQTSLVRSATGWVLIGGGGGSGTVTSVGLTVPSSLFVSPVTGSPVTAAGTLAMALATQSANRVFAGPSSGIAATPTFRVLTTADLGQAAAPPAGGVQYNDGTNAFTAETGFLWDAATGTLQLGVSPTRSGRMQLRSLVSGSTTFTVDNPSSAHVITMPNALPSTNDLLRASAVSGSNITWGYVAPSALGFPTINLTDNVLPFRLNSSAFSDSPLFRASATVIGFGGVSSSFPGLRRNSAKLDVRLADDSAYAEFQASAGNFFNSSNIRKVLIFPTNGYVSLASDIYYGWSNNTSDAAPSDTSLHRLGAGVVRVGVGGSGAGQFVVGSSVASTSHQFLVDSQSTSRIAGYFTMPGSSSVATIKAETSSVQSFAFFPTGKIIGGMNSPTCNQQTAMIGNAKSGVSTIGNVGTGVDNLLSFVIQANALANTGDYAEFDAFGEFAPGVDNKTLKVVYGATTIFNTGATPFDGGNWRLNVKILRTGASAGKSIATFWNNGLVSPFLQEIFITTESFTANKTVQFTGEATTTDDITQLHLESKLVVALTS